MDKANFDLKPYWPTIKPVLHKVVNDIKFCNVVYYTTEHTFSSLVLYICSRHFEGRWSNNILWYICWEPELRSQQRQTLLGNGFVNTSVAMQWLSNSHFKTETDTHATTEDLLEAVFSVRPVPRLYNEDQPPLPVSTSRESVSRQRVCRQSVESCRNWWLRLGTVREPGGRGTSAVESRYQVAHEDRYWEHKCPRDSDL
jgi:hypothetical protein